MLVCFLSVNHKPSHHASCEFVWRSVHRGARARLRACARACVCARADGGCRRRSAERILAILRQNGTVQGCLYLLMLNLSAHLTRELGMAPGGEFRVAYQEVSQATAGPRWPPRACGGVCYAAMRC